MSSCAGSGSGGPAAGLGYSTFGGTIPGAAGGLGTDVVYGASPFGFAGSPLFGAHAPSPFAAVNPFTGSSLFGAGYGPSYAWQQAPWTGGQTAWGGQVPWGAGQSPWTPTVEAARQAQVTQTLAAKQSVLEAMCRAAGIPV